MARGVAPVRPSRYRVRWPVLLTAVIGAWLGHFVEYVRVAGWHAGVASMTAADHAYFLPAGAGLVLTALAAVAVIRRAWMTLKSRLNVADTTLRRPTVQVATPATEPTPLRIGPTSVTRLWAVLTLLQTAIWVVQENLETIAGGHRPPLLSVVSGVHLLARVVQAEVALLLSQLFVLVCRRYQSWHSRVRTLERVVARRWRAGRRTAPA